MTRFHVIAIVTAIAGATAISLGSLLALGVIFAAFAMVMGFGVAFPQWRMFGPFICQGDSSQQRVALTFDDGPDPRSTSALLDLLRAENVPATFFCIGRHVAAHPELAARIAQDGHLLGNHTYTHSNATNFFGLARLTEEMSRTQSAMRDAAGVAPVYFRPPMGLSNPRVFKAASSLGLKVVGWTARGIDTQIRDSNRVVQRILRGVRPGAIILLHDGNIPPERLLPTVKLLLAKLRGQGYQFARLDHLIK
ncbi:MAG: polysaccharide deacetylase family protein [Verrucomicrobia bacterium]|nr:polysaccharide deacetylase family protein [Verrucomicrobiota bacterium]